MSELEGFTKICSIDDVKENQGKKFIVGSEEIALFKVKGKFYALSNVCPHQHTSIIYDGFLDAGYVFCPAHGWQFNLETGKQPDGRSGLQSYELIINADEIWIKVVKKEMKW